MGRVEQYQIRTQISEGILYPSTKKNHGQKIMPMSKPGGYPSGMDIHWFLPTRICSTQETVKSRANSKVSTLDNIR